ncbi:MAG: CPBP family intramembrane metalloprotease [Oscillospiraceae bacterium]|nr:CPBP family intramembrane metalloprotease [Oscillospiraceae bacterium]
MTTDITATEVTLTETAETTEIAEISKKEARRRFSRIGFALLVMVVLQQGGAGALIALVNNIPALAVIDWMPIIVNFLPLYLLALPAVILILRGLEPMPSAAEKRRVSAGTVVPLVFVCYASTVAINLAGTLLYGLLAQIKGGEVTNPLTDFVLGSNPFVMLPFVVLVSPLVEEYIFRGLLFKYLGAFGAKPYMLFSALTFALFHANLAQVPYAFILGLVFAGLTYYSGTIKYAVIAHIIVNFFGSAVPILMLKIGGEETGIMLAGLAAVLLAGIGIISALVLLGKRKLLRFSPASLLLPKGVMIHNAGTIAFILVLSALTILVLML